MNIDILKINKCNFIYNLDKMVDVFYWDFVSS